MRPSRIAGTLLVGLVAAFGTASAEKSHVEAEALPAKYKLAAPSWRPLDAYPLWAPERSLAAATGGATPQTATLISAQIFRDRDTTTGKGNEALLPTCVGQGNDTAEDTWYKLVLPQGGTVTAWTTCASQGIVTYDTRLGIFTESLTLYACNDDDQTCGIQSRINNLSLAAGTYYIVVDGFNGASGPYELNVQWQGPGPPCSGSNATTATVISSLPFGETRDLSNDCDDYLVTCEVSANQGGPDHWYRVTVDTPVLMDVATTCNAANIDTRIAILDDAQNQLYCNDNASGCPSGQSAIVDALLSEGTYYLVIDSATLAGGSYAVQVDTTHAAPGSIVDRPPDILTRENELYDHDIVTTIAPGRTHLRLSNATANIGLSKLYLYGVFPASSDSTQEVRQRVWQNDGTYYDRDAGTFIYHPAHAHIHLQDWAVYRLREVTTGGGVGAIVVEGSKTSFCVLDLIIHDSGLPGFFPSPLFNTCGSSIQGLSIGWADIYNKDLSGQNIDITDVPPGEYWLESEADPLNHVLEANETNNIARILVTIGGTGVINPDAYEANDTRAELDSRPVGGPNSPVLGPCGPSKTITGLTIHTAGNDDYFRFYMPATGGNTDDVRIDFTNANGNLSLALLNSAGTVLATSEGTNNSEKVSLKNHPAGWYDVRVYGFLGSTSPSYSLTIDPPQNASPSITVSNPPAGDTPVPQTGTYTTTWTAGDPDGNPTWVNVYVNTTPALDGNQIFLPTSQNTPGSQGSYIINPAPLQLDTYYVYAQITDGGTIAGDWSTGTFTITPVTAVEETPGIRSWGLLPTFPNPFNPSARASLRVPRASHVSWRIYDARGALVRTLQNGLLPVGVHERAWDGRDDRGRAVASGAYYMVVKAPGYTGRQKLTLLR